VQSPPLEESALSFGSRRPEVASGACPGVPSSRVSSARATYPPTSRDSSSFLRYLSPARLVLGKPCLERGFVRLVRTNKTPSRVVEGAYVGLTSSLKSSKRVRRRHSLTLEGGDGGPRALVPKNSPLTRAPSWSRRHPSTHPKDLLGTRGGRGPIFDPKNSSGRVEFSSKFATYGPLSSHGMARGDVRAEREGNS
jgi:hypothetical protein